MYFWLLMQIVNNYVVGVMGLAEEKELSEMELTEMELAEEKELSEM